MVGIEYELKIDDELVASILEREEDKLTFNILCPEIPVNSRCVYALVKFRRKHLVPLIRIAFLPENMGKDKPIGYVKGIERLSVRYHEVGMAQLNIVGDRALVWECYVYRDYNEEWEQMLSKVWDWLEKWLSKKSVKEVYAHSYEPEYDGYPFSVSERGYWFAEFLVKRGYEIIDMAHDRAYKRL